LVAAKKKALVAAQTFLAVHRRNAHHLLPMGDYPGRKQVRTRAKRAAKNDRIIEKRAAEKKAAAKK
jgi:hypothetical protein